MPASSPAVTSGPDDTKETKPPKKDDKETKSEAAGSAQQKTEHPPPAVPQVAPRAEAAVEPGQMYLELKYNVDGTSLQGNRTRSFLNEGINHTGEISFFSNQPVWGIRRFEHLAVGRYTDNPRVDPERNSLQRFYAKLTGPTFMLNLGDALVNYSRFSFNQNIKGLHGWKNIGEKVRLIGTLGYFTDRWGSLYRDFTVFRDVTNPLPPNPANPTKPYSRAVAGLRAERKLARNGWLAANYSHGQDLQQSLPAAFLTCEDALGVRTVRQVVSGCLPGETEVAGLRRPATEAIVNDIFSLDTSMEITPFRVRVNGEVASSWTAGDVPAGVTSTNFTCSTQPPVVGGAVLDARCFDRRVQDWAARGEATQRVGKLNWRVDYSRFQPNFFSANARQIRDLQDLNIRGEYEIIPQATIMASWRRSNDNLNGERNFTSIVRAPEVRLTLRQLPIHRKMTLDLGYRERNQDTNGDPQGITCIDALTGGVTIRRTPAPAPPACLAGETTVPNLFRKRSTRIPYLSLNLPISTSMFTFDYEHRREKDDIRPELSTDTDRFAFSFRGNYSWGGWDFLPTFRFELERLDKDLAVDPTNLAPIFPVDFFAAFDTNRSIQAGFQLEAPKYLRFEGHYREFNAVLLSQSGVSYFNQGFKRPSWRGAVIYKFRNDENKTLTAYYERTNNFFVVIGPVDDKSFRETVIGGTLQLRFRR